MSPKSKRRLRFDNFVYENSTSFVSDDEGFSRDKDGYGGTIIYECVHCDHKTRWKSALKRHFIRMHGLKPKKPILKPGEILYECVLCDHSTKWQSAYRRHMRSKHGIVKVRSLSRKEKKRYQCAFCGFEQYNIKELAHHIRFKHPAPFVRSNNIKKRMQKHSNLVKRPLKIYEIVYNYDLFAPRMDLDPSNWL